MLVSSTKPDTTTYDTSKLTNVDNNHGTLTQTDFLNLFIKQMQSQDPTSPMDSAQMMQQTATFTQVQSMTEMSQNILKMVEASTNSSSTAQLASAANFIGKVMEYSGNDTTLTGSGAAISFDTAAIPSKTNVTIRDAQGNFVRTLSPTVTDTGKQYLVWDGTDANGNKMANGKYSFSVSAVDDKGTSVGVTTYSNGQVTGVSTENGTLVYEIDGKYDVSPDKVVSVRDASTI